MSARLVSSKTGPARKYYRPTLAGYEALATQTANWFHLAGIVGAALNRALPAEPTKGS